MKSQLNWIVNTKIWVYMNTELNTEYQKIQASEYWIE